MLGTGCPDPQNMFRKCYRLNLPDPHSSPLGATCAQIMVTKQEIRRLSKVTLALRRQHLLDLIEDAKKHDNTIRAKAILEILNSEEQKKWWQWIKFSIHPPRGGNPTAIQVQTPIETMKYDTEETVFHNAMEHLLLRFRLAHSTHVTCHRSLKTLDILVIPSVPRKS